MVECIFKKLIEQKNWFHFFWHLPTNFGSNFDNTVYIGITDEAVQALFNETKCTKINIQKLKIIVQVHHQNLHSRLFSCMGARVINCFSKLLIYMNLLPIFSELWQHKSLYILKVIWKKRINIGATKIIDQSEQIYLQKKWSGFQLEPLFQ